MQAGMGVLDRFPFGGDGGSVRAGCGAVWSMVGELTLFVNFVKGWRVAVWRERADWLGMR